MISSLTLVSGGTPEPRIFMLALTLPNFVILEGGITSSLTSLDIALYGHSPQLMPIYGHHPDPTSARALSHTLTQPYINTLH